MFKNFVIILFGLLVFGEAKANPSIVGEWFYYKKIYRGVEMPEPPEATLRLYFSFSENGESRLWYWHEGEKDWCERKGQYQWEDNVLKDKIVWVNPKNSSHCSRDPDMQNGGTSTAPLAVMGEDLWLTVNVGDETLIYIWKKTSNPIPGHAFQ
jgi:hypothetical protein